MLCARLADAARLPKAVHITTAGLGVPPAVPPAVPLTALPAPPTDAGVLLKARVLAAAAAPAAAPETLLWKSEKLTPDPSGGPDPDALLSCGPGPPDARLSCGPDPDTRLLFSIASALGLRIAVLLLCVGLGSASAAKGVLLLYLSRLLALDSELLLQGEGVRALLWLWLVPWRPPTDLLVRREGCVAATLLFSRVVASSSRYRVDAAVGGRRLIWRSGHTSSTTVWWQHQFSRHIQ
jgi:hypothetical protein